MTNPNAIAADALLVQLDEDAIEKLREDGKLVVPSRGAAPSVVLDLAEFVEPEEPAESPEDRGVR